MATANPTYSAIMRNRYPEEVQQAFELIAKGDCAGAVKNIASIATKLGTLPDEVMFHLRDKEHRTIIHHASFHGQTDAIRTIMEVHLKNSPVYRDPLLRARDKLDGHDAMAYATLRGHSATVNELFFHGLDIDDNVSHQRMIGHTPLQNAALLGAEDLVQTLLDLGADPNKTTLHTKETPLHLAARSGHINIAKRLLLAEPSLLDRRDIEGYTAFQRAVDRGQRKMGNFLRDGIFELQSGHNVEIPRNIWASLSCPKLFLQPLKPALANDPAY